MVKVNDRDIKTANNLLKKGLRYRAATEKLGIPPTTLFDRTNTGKIREEKARVKLENQNKAKELREEQKRLKMELKLQKLCYVCNIQVRLGQKFCLLCNRIAHDYCVETDSDSHIICESCQGK